MLESSVMKALMQARIHAGLKRVYIQYVDQGTNYPPIADEMWELLADAISDIAIDIVNQIQTEAEVVPGIAVTVTGNATTQSGQPTAPGKII